ncbi:hypothetical protein PUN28_008026 [Cardiocondyla obscurior]|uniref:Secreted protein n=1 Tax=Cardiocondyla obscurior TaxID=286306 RepID=A0AAW2FVM9_9HYME
MCPVFLFFFFFFSLFQNKETPSFGCARGSPARGRGWKIRSHRAKAPDRSSVGLAREREASLGLSRKNAKHRHIPARRVFANKESRMICERDAGEEATMA